MMRIIKCNERKYNIEIAKACGLREAVIANCILDMHIWAVDMKAVDGKTWVKCSQKAIIDRLPFLTEETVRTSVRKLAADGIIRYEVMSEDKFDRTYWYSFTDRGEKLLRCEDCS